MTETTWPDHVTLGEARRWLRQEAEDHGAPCPCCTQRAQVYRRTINSGMARALILMYRAAGTEWLHVPTALDARSREEGKLRYWGLVEEERERREDGGRAGWWRVTDAGRRFALGRSVVPKYAHIYDGRCLRLDPTTMVSIVQCLGKRFNLRALLDGEQ